MSDLRLLRNNLLSAGKIAVYLAFLVFSAFAQEKSDREKDELKGSVKSVKEETSEIFFINGRPAEKKRLLQNFVSYSISGNKLKYYAYDDDGKVLYGDTYFYDAKNKLIETKTVHSQFLHLCDSKTYIYDENGRLSEELCHLTGQDVIGKTVYRYDTNNKLFEEERIPLKEARLYYSQHSLKRYQYTSEGELEEVNSFTRIDNQWVPANNSLENFKSKYFSNSESHVSTELKYDAANTLKSVTNSLNDDDGNEIETITYLPDSSIKEGNRYKYQYDNRKNYIKQIESEWVIEDGKSFFQPVETTYRQIIYYSPKELSNSEEAKAPTSVSAQSQSQSLELEDYKIYSQLINDWVNNESIKQIVIKKFPQSSHFTENNVGFGVEIETVDDFTEKNKKRNFQLQENLFSSSKKITLLADSEEKEIFSNDKLGWAGFYKRYPDSQGITTFSRVGFNKNRTQAIVYYGTQSDWLAGAGFIVILQKENQGWKITKKQMLWIS